MSGFDYFLIGWWIFGVLMTVGQIGQPKTPTTPRVAVISTLIVGSLIFGLLASRGALS